MFETKRLGVNIDHIATLRQARGTHYPDPLKAARIAEAVGADIITVHLREDRRHIQREDVEKLKQTLKIPLNLEMAATEAMCDIAETIRPKFCCIVPEKREELTTEGGLDVVRHFALLKNRVARLSDAGIAVSVFIEPDANQIEAAKALGIPEIELHTGHYADANDPENQRSHLHQITRGAELAASCGLQVNAGHGLNYDNVAPIAAIPQIQVLNIGHAIIAEACWEGLGVAIQKIQSLIRKAPCEALAL